MTVLLEPFELVHTSYSHLSDKIDSLSFTCQHATLGTGTFGAVESVRIRSVASSNLKLAQVLSHGNVPF